MIRRARFGDIPGLYRLIGEGHANSRYAASEEIDEREAKALLMRCIQRHGSPNVGGSCVFVAEAGGRIDGFIVGLLDRVYHLGRRFSAEDLFFYVSPDSEPTMAGRLIDAYVAWAEANEKVIEIKLAATDIIDDWRRTAHLYERKGFHQIGAIYERASR